MTMSKDRRARRLSRRASALAALMASSSSSSVLSTWRELERRRDIMLGDLGAWVRERRWLLLRLMPPVVQVVVLVLVLVDEVDVLVALPPLALLAGLSLSDPSAPVCLVLTSELTWDLLAERLKEERGLAALGTRGEEVSDAGLIASERTCWQGLSQPNLVEPTEQARTHLDVSLLDWLCDRVRSEALWIQCQPTVSKQQTKQARRLSCQNSTQLTNHPPQPTRLGCLLAPGLASFVSTLTSTLRTGPQLVSRLVGRLRGLTVAVAWPSSATAAASSILATMVATLVVHVGSAGKAAGGLISTGPAAVMAAKAGDMRLERLAGLPGLEVRCASSRAWSGYALSSAKRAARARESQLTKPLVEF